jgi:hypothetical protein
MAAAGASIGGLPGGIIGGAVGFLSSLFGGGPDPEEIMAERKRRAQVAIAEAYTAARKNLAIDAKEAVAQASQGAARRALAGGREASEGDIAASTGKVYSETGRAMRDLAEKEASANTELEAGYAARPIEQEMPLSEVLLNLGASAASINNSFKQQAAIDAQRKAAEHMQTEAIKPESTLLDEIQGLPALSPKAVQPGSPYTGPLAPQTAAPGIELEQVSDALSQSNNPYAQGSEGAKVGPANRGRNMAMAKLPGVRTTMPSRYGSLMNQLNA